MARRRGREGERAMARRRDGEGGARARRWRGEGERSELGEIFQRWKIFRRLRNREFMAMAEVVAVFSAVVGLLSCYFVLLNS